MIHISFLLYIIIALFFSVITQAFECPPESFVVEFTSSITNQRSVTCTKKVDGQYIKHGLEVIYSLSGVVNSKVLYINNKAVSNNNLQKNKNNQEEPNSDLFVSNEYGFSIKKISKWHFVQRKDQERLISESDNLPATKESMASKVKFNILTISKSLYYLANSNQQIIPRISIFKIVDTSPDRNDPIDSCNLAQKYFDQKTNFTTPCKVTNLNKIKIVQTEATYLHDLDQGTKTNYNIKVTTGVWFLKHRGHSLVFVFSREDKSKILYIEKELEQMIKTINFI